MSMHFDLKQTQTQNIKQLQRMMMSPQMRQAVHLMQLPLQELATIIEAEMEQNPLLEYLEEKLDEENTEESQDQDNTPEEELSFHDNELEILKRLDEDFRDHFAESENYYTKRTQEEEKRKTFLEQSIPSHLSLFEYLMQQAHETFDTEKDLEMAEMIIGNLDSNGFLSTPLKEIAALYQFEEDNLKEILTEIQKFDPMGIGARNLQETLLIQLRQHKQQKTLAYKIIEKHFDDLLHNRIPMIQKGLKCSPSQIREAIEQQISHLDLHPGVGLSQGATQHIVPDVTIEGDEDQLSVRINEEHLPFLRLNKRYLRMLEDESLAKESKEYIRNKLMSAKWLLKNIDQRNDTLHRVVETLLKTQKKFFQDPEGKLVPLTMKAVAEELDLHESTVARAVANKYVNSPRGIFPLRHFFSNAYTTDEGDDISSKTVRDVLKQIIDEENKKHPLSDEAISKLMARRGIQCARRTIAKYRTELKLGNAQQRRMY